jgi:hypothetical protein
MVSKLKLASKGIFDGKKNQPSTQRMRLLQPFRAIPTTAVAFPNVAEELKARMESLKSMKEIPKEVEEQRVRHARYKARLASERPQSCYSGSVPPEFVVKSSRFHLEMSKDEQVSEQKPIRTEIVKFPPEPAKPGSQWDDLHVVVNMPRNEEGDFFDSLDRTSNKTRDQTALIASKFLQWNDTIRKHPKLDTPFRRAQGLWPM